MALKNVHYHRLETEDSAGEEDESPPTHVHLNNAQHGKGNRWNHIENLDHFFERVYWYQQEHGLAAIALRDFLGLIQFMFMVLFTTFIVTCLRLQNLLIDKITFTRDNFTGERDVAFEDIFDVSRLENIHPIVVMILIMALVFWLQRLYRAVRRFFKFWEIRTFYTEALNIPPSELRDYIWPDVLVKLKQAQKEYKMNIQKQELTELDVYHRILRHKNYLVAMFNKSVLPSKFWIPFYGEKVFCTHGLQFNYEMILFWGPGAPFRSRFYLKEEYKSAARKHELVKNLRFRIAVLALLNLLFSPFILLYQILYSFFSYAELLKRQPGVFGRRRWSTYGKWFLRDFNELDHELMLRLNRAYKPSVYYADLFTHPIVAIVASNLAFFAGSLLAVLLVLTVIQEDLLTAHNVLTIITFLGIVVTACRIFIPDENQVWCPSLLMQRILGEIHYVPDDWKQYPHSIEVYRDFTHVFQFTMMQVLDELLSPLVTPFILYFSLRNKASDIVDFLRNFTIDVSGVGDVCSFAEMNIKRHGNPEWLSKGVTRANQYEQAELGKTEISLMHFSRKNPNWRPSEDGEAFMKDLKESVEDMHRSQMSTSGQGSLTYLQLPTPAYSPPHVSPGSQTEKLPPILTTSTHPTESVQWSIWSSMRPGQPTFWEPPYSSRSQPLDTSTLDTLNLHQVRDQRRVEQHLSTGDPIQRPRPVTLFSSQASIEEAWTVPSPETVARATELSEPLLQAQEHAGDVTVIQIHDKTEQK